MCHESGFLGECVGRCHPGFGRRRRAVELQDSLRRMNLQELVETRPRFQWGFRQHPFRGGGSLPFELPGEAFA